MTDPRDTQFSVYWWDRDGGQHTELRFVAVVPAMEASRRLAYGPASVFRYVERIIITDGGDFTCFEWKIDEGVTFPTPAERAAHRKKESRA